MRIKGALHVHSTYSHDGRLTIAEVAALYRGKGFHFVAIGEHSQDMTEEKVKSLVVECARESSAEFLLIPGIEFTCRPEGMHLLGVATLGLTTSDDPVTVAQHVRAQGGFCVLAHPRRVGWDASPELLQAVHAAEVWNIGYDGKYLPAWQAPSAFRRMLRKNPRLLVTAAHDLHRRIGFYEVWIELQADVISQSNIMRRLFAGEYRIRSPFFNCDAQLGESALRDWYVRLFGGALRGFRRLKWALERSGP